MDHSIRIPLDTWQQQGRYVTIDGHNIFFKCEGRSSNPTVLLVHGFLSSSWDWNAQWQALVEDYFVITLDFLGMGFSDKPNFKYSTYIQADICEGLLRHLDVREYHVIAHDYGNSVIQELMARKAPILSVQFLNGGLFPETHHPVFLQKLLVSPLGVIAQKFFTYRLLKKAIQKICVHELSEEYFQGLWKMHRFNNGHNRLHQLIHYLPDRYLNRERWVTALKDCKVPLQLINGVDDPVSGIHMIKRFYEVVGERPTVLLEGIGHIPQVESPQKTQDAMLSFLKQHS